MKTVAFSLLETLVALSIGLTLLLLGAFAFRQTPVNTRLTTETNRLVSIIEYARIEAIRRNEIVTLCHSADGVTCRGRWRDGLMVTAGHEILRVLSALPEGDDLTWRSSLARNDSLQFESSGFTKGQNGSFLYCTGRGEGRACSRVVVARSGRVRVKERPS